jgi:thiosulfate/3-mercaptopyruvate sulfurtransferase
VVDVRTDARELSDEGSGPRLRAASNVELRPFAHLGGPAGWRTSKERYGRRRGASGAFQRGHVPGALALDVRAELFDDAGELVSAPELALVMSGLGVGDGDTVVFVDEGNPAAALVAAWALARYGHFDVHVLEGGFTRWIAEGRKVTKEIVRLVPASFTARVLA